MSTEPPQTPPAGATPADPASVRSANEPSSREAAANKVAANAKSFNDEEAVDALDWLLSDAPLAETIPTKDLELNVGTDEKPKWIKWTIMAIDENEIRQIRRRANGTNRSQRRQGGEFDQDQFNLMVMAAGTQKPDLVAASQRMPDGQGGQGFADPATALRRRFARKWGIVTLVSGEIIALSGMDDEAVRDAKEVRVAGG